MIENKIKCTVGILTYNSEMFLERCLNGLSRFAEIIIADGGSTDKTLKIAQTYGCKIISQSNPGKPIEDFAFERNRMLEASSQDWFFYLDSDEIISPKLVAEIEAISQMQNPPYFVYRVPYHIISADLKTVYKRFKNYYQMRLFHKQSNARFVRKMHERIEFDEKRFRVGSVKGSWYVSLDTQLDFAVYKSKVDHRLTMMMQEIKVPNLISFLKFGVVGPLKECFKQLVKFVYLHIRFKHNQLIPWRYDMYKFYSQWVICKVSTTLYLQTFKESVRKLIKITMLSMSWLVAYCTRTKSTVSILLYHSVDNQNWKHSVNPDIFEKQMKYLKEKYHIISLEDAVSWVQGKKQVLPSSIVITFDDGYKDNYEKVFTILKKYNIPATIFLTTNLAKMEKLAFLERLTETEVKQLADSKLVSIEAHGQSHKNLLALSVSELEQEIVKSKEEVLRMTDRSPQFFAYPFGNKNKDVESAVSKHFKAALGIKEGSLKQHSNLFSLGRIQVDKSVTFFEFRLKLTGAVDINRVIVDWIRTKFK